METDRIIFYSIILYSAGVAPLYHITLLYYYHITIVLSLLLLLLLFYYCYYYVTIAIML